VPVVNGVHKEQASSGTHQHIAEVCVGSTHYTRAQVVSGLDSGESWKTQGRDGTQARIKKITYCPAVGCMLTPYITTEPDHTKTNNLDNLPAC